jgi:uncharacterized 2Fe-2S/4Fe-4S cluster protein (DUF4445 family)
VLCTDIMKKSKDVIMFIDIGTNGEIVIGNSEYLITCACSAGPAFEGGEIECGMRAALGAIDKVNIGRNGKLEYSVIGDVKPRGICGSGMISLIAGLFLNKIIEPDGKLSRNNESVVIDGRKAFFIIADENMSAAGSRIYISEQDIENILRAKAAIYSATALILEQVELTVNDLKKIYIAGGFGKFLDINDAKIIGLVPDLPDDRYEYIGNSSLMGSYLTLVSGAFRDIQYDIKTRMTYIDLSNSPGYMDHYMSALFLPHTNIDLFPTVKALI